LVRFTTPIRHPLAPSITDYEFSHGHLKITWNPPQNNNCVDVLFKFLVTTRERLGTNIYGPEYTALTTSTTYMMENYKQHLTYEVQVQALSRELFDGVELKSSNNPWITLQFPQTPNKPEMGLFSTFNHVSELSDHGFQIRINPSIFESDRTDSFTVTVDGPGGPFVSQGPHTQLISGLQPESIYTATVTANNEVQQQQQQQQQLYHYSYTISNTYYFNNNYCTATTPTTATYTTTCLFVFLRSSFSVRSTTIFF